MIGDANFASRSPYSRALFLTMKRDELYNFMMKVEGKDTLIVTFSDGDKYKLSDLDLCPSFGYEGEFDEEPIEAKFERCLSDSNKLKEALRLGWLKPDGVYWSSETKRPYSVVYESRDVESIFEEEKQYFVYQLKHNKTLKEDSDNNSAF